MKILNLHCIQTNELTIAIKVNRFSWLKKNTFTVSNHSICRILKMFSLINSHCYNINLKVLKEHQINIPSFTIGRIFHGGQEYKTSINVSTLPLKAGKNQLTLSNKITIKCYTRINVYFLSMFKLNILVEYQQILERFINHLLIDKYYKNSDDFKKETL